MSERLYRKRIPANRRSATNSRAPRASPSPSAPRRIRPAPVTHNLKSTKDLKILRKSRSEPFLWKPGGDFTFAQAADSSAWFEEGNGGVLYRPQTCTDVFSSRENSNATSPRMYPEGYNRDAKVVVNVTVEGSPGPIRTLVKLGCSVEETINLVISKYNEQCRTPFIHQNSVSDCQLHQSSFNLESLRKSALIGDIGGRSFYLRKSCGGDGVKGDPSNKDLNESDIALPFIPSFINQKIQKIIQRSPKFFELFGCIQCFGLTQ